MRLTNEQEVPGYWQNGMNVSDDVTLLWSDDNRGNIRRIPIANETNRRGGSGIYVRPMELIWNWMFLPVTDV
jgi:hypothetical protein